MEVKSVEVSSDHRSVTLHIRDLQPVMQMQIQMKIDAEDGTPMEYTICNTINTVPGYVPHPKPATAPASQPDEHIVAVPATQASVSHEAAK